MAILQETNAVFYHPLDDPTESLQAQAWIGSRRFGLGKVTDALLPESGGSVVGFGPESEFFSGTLASPRGSGPVTAALDSTKFVVAYRSASQTGGGIAVGTVSGTDVTFGTPAPIVPTGDASEISIAALSDTLFVYSYKDSIDNKGKARLGVVSGTDWAPAAQAGVQFVLSLGDFAAIAALSPTSFAIVYRDGTATMAIPAVVLPGPQIVFGPEKTISATGASQWISAIALDSTRFVAAYTNTAAGTATVGTVSGTDLTLGAEANFLGAAVDRISVTALSDAKVVVVHNMAGNFSQATVGLVSGNIIAFGTPHVFLSSAARFASAVALSSTRFAVAYRDIGGPFSGTVKVGTVAGIDITYGPEEEFLTGAPTGPTAISAVGMSAGILVAYADSGDSGHGTVKIGALSNAPASLAGGQSTAWGPEALFETGGQARYTDVVALDATRFVVSYVDIADSSHGKARVGTVSGTDITYGAEATFWGGAVGTDPRLAPLSASKFVVVWIHTSQTGAGIVGTVSGTTITFGLWQAFASTGSASIGAAAALSSSKMVVFWFKLPSSSQGRATVGTVSGTDITWGAEAVLSLSTTNLMEAAALDATTVVAIYHMPPTNVRAKVGTVSGTDITFGAEETLPTAVLVGSMSVTRLDGSKVLVCRELSVENSAVSNVGTVSGTSIGFGADAIFGGDGVNGSSRISVVATGPATVVVSWRDDSVGPGMLARVGAVSGSTVTWSVATSSYQAATTGDEPRMALVGTSLVVGYDLDASPSHGRVNVGAVGTFSYPTVVGGEHVTFATWTRSPTTPLPPAPTAGSPVTYAGFNIADTVIVRLTDTTVFTAIAHSNSQASGRVGVVSGSTVLFPSSAEDFDAVPTTGPAFAAAALDSSHVVVVWPVSTANGQLAIASVSGTTVSWGASSNFAASNVSGAISVTAVDSTHFVLAFGNGDTLKGQSRVGVTVGTAISLGPLVDFHSLNCLDVSVAAVSATKVVVAYRDTASGIGRAKVGTVSGPSIAFGPEATFEAGTNVNHLSSDGVGDGSRVVVGYSLSGTADGRVVVGTVAGSDVTFGPPAVFVDVGAPSSLGVAWIGGTSVMVAYAEGLGPPVNVKTGTVHGGVNVVFGPASSALTASGANVSVARVTSPSGVVAYRDTDDSSKGKVNVLTQA